MTTTRRILLAEDDPNDVKFTLRALAEYNLDGAVDVVSDGEQALDYLYRRGVYEQRSEGHPVVVIMDIKMPRVDGLEVLKRIRTDPALRLLPVVMLTSSREERDIVAAYEQWVNAYVVKPMDFLSYLEAVKPLGQFWAIINEPPLLTQKT